MAHDEGSVRAITPRLTGDEAMRQHMRAMRKAMATMEKSTIETKIAEHEKAIEHAKQVLQGMQEQANTIQTDVVRRQGAIVALRELIGQWTAQPEGNPIEAMAQPLESPLIHPNGA